LKKTDKDRKKKERMKVKLMATSDPELKDTGREKIEQTKITYLRINLKMEAADNDRNTVSRREFVLIENVNRNRPETNVQTLTGT